MALGAYCYLVRPRPAWARGLYSVGLWATGNARGCTLADCFDQLSTRILEREREIDRAISLQGTTTDGLSRWATPIGEIYTDGKAPLSFLVAEQMSGAYDVGQCRVHKGDIVLDCGANVGTFTRKALLDGAALVVAIEVDPSSVVCLRRTFEREIAEKRVIIIGKGVWDKEDKLKLSVYSNSALSSLVMTERVEDATKPTEVEVPLTTIDRIVSDLTLPAVHLIKMDIEGAERNALRGARQTIERFQPRLAVATENLPDDIDVIPTVVKGLRPAYRQVNGPCRIIRPPFVMRPEVVCFF